MPKRTGCRARLIFCFSLALSITTRASAQTLVWNNGAGGVFGTATNWTPNTVPALSTHTAVFNLAANYIVTLNSSPSFGTLAMQAGSVAFNATGRTMTVTADAVLSPGRTTTWNGGTLTIAAGADLEANGTFNIAAGSFVRADQVFAGLFGQTGHININTATLLANGNVPHYIGWGGASIGRMQFSTNAVGTFNGGLDVGETGSAASGRLTLLTGSDITTGSLSVGNTTNISLTQGGGAIVMTDAGTTLTQTGASPLTVGGGTLIIDNVNDDIKRSGEIIVESGAVFTSGTGPILVRGGGNIETVFSAVNLNGDVLIENTGRIRSSFGSVLTFSPTRTVRVESRSEEIGIFSIVDAPGLFSGNVSSGGTLIIGDAASADGWAEFLGTSTFGAVTSGNGGQGLLNLGGTVSFASLTAGAQGGSDGAISVNTNRTAISGLMVIGDFGEGQMLGGSASFTTNGVIMAQQLNSRGVIETSGIWANTGTFIAGGAGSAELTVQGGTFSTTSLAVGQGLGGVARFEVGTGTSNTFATSSNTFIGQGGLGIMVVRPRGTFTATGPVVMAASIFGSGQLSILGGTPQVNSATFEAAGQRITVGAAGDATITIGTNGFLNVGTLQVGSNAGAFAIGSGTFIQSGGTLNAAAVNIGTTTASTGRWFLSGGEANAGNLLITSNGILAITEGTLTTTTATNDGFVTMGGGQINGAFTNNRSFAYNGGLLSGTFGNSGTLNLNTLLPPGTGVINNNVGGRVISSGLAVGGAGTINNFGTFGGTGTFIAGGALNNNGTLSSAGGEFVIAAAATFSNGSAGLLRNAALSTLRILPAAFTNFGSAEVNAGGGIEFLSPLNVPTGESIRMNGGVLATAGTTTINLGASLVGHGQINTNLLNRGSVSLNGTTELHGVLTNAAGGTITARNATTIVYGTATNAGVIVAGTAGTIIFEGGISSTLPDPGRFTADPSGRAVANFIRQGTLTINGAAANAGEFALRRINEGGSISRLQSLIIAGTPGSYLGRLDLADSALVIDHTGANPLTTIRTYLQSGYNAGAWGALGITSSAAELMPGTAIGFAEATAIGSPPTFLGEPIDATTILLRYTLTGDADLSGSVNLDDFTRLAAGFGSIGSTWTSGDFNYDGFTNLDDFTALAANFGLTLPADVPRGAAVPEPALGSLVLFLTGSMARRRR